MRDIEHRCLVFLTVPRCPDEPTVGSHVAPDFAFKNQLLRDALHGRWRHIDLIKKQDSLHPAVEIQVDI